MNQRLERPSIGEILAGIIRNRKLTYNSKIVVRILSEMSHKLLLVFLKPILGSEFDIVSLNISSCVELPCQMPRGAAVNVSTVFNDFGEFKESIVVRRINQNS